MNGASPVGIRLAFAFPGGSGLKALMHERFNDFRLRDEWFQWHPWLWHSLHWLSFCMRRTMYGYREPDTIGSCLPGCEDCEAEFASRGDTVVRVP